MAVLAHAAGMETGVAARGLSFDVAYMALQAAIDGVGVALGYAPYVAAGSQKDVDGWLSPAMTVRVPP